MQDEPDRDVLLDAISRFLADLAPTVGDPALGFRVRIAAHLLGGLAREGRSESDADAAHLLALEPGAEVPADRTARRAAIRSASASLAERIRSGELDADLPGLAERLRAVALTQARIGNPRFE